MRTIIKMKVYNEVDERLCKMVDLRVGMTLFKVGNKYYRKLKQPSRKAPLITAL